MTVTRDSLQERWDDMFGDEIRICIFCDNSSRSFYCSQCGEYKGLVSVEEWESYTGEEWL